MNQSKTLPRQSNLELLRIVAMILIVCLHANYYALGWVSAKELSATPLISTIRIQLELLTIVPVNIFILISGWFGIRPTLKGGASFIYQVIFFSCLSSIILLITSFALGIGGGHNNLDTSKLTSFLSASSGLLYWFVPAYLLLYAFSPVLNAFVEHSSPKKILGFLIVFFFLQTSLGWLKDFANFNQGYSVVSFIGLYILARFIRLHSIFLTKLSRQKLLALYFISLIIPCLLFVLTHREFKIIVYSSPFVIAGSLFLMLFFTKISFSNKMVNTVAASVFPVYLMHMHPLTVNYFVDLMNWAYSYFSGAVYIVFVLGFALVLVLVSVLLDRVRLFSWQLICRLFGDRMFDFIMAKFNLLASNYEQQDRTQS